MSYHESIILNLINISNICMPNGIKIKWVICFGLSRIYVTKEYAIAMETSLSYYSNKISFNINFFINYRIIWDILTHLFSGNLHLIVLTKYCLDLAIVSLNILGGYMIEMTKLKIHNTGNIKMN